MLQPVYRVEIQHDPGVTARRAHEQVEPCTLRQDKENRRFFIISRARAMNQTQKKFRKNVFESSGHRP